MNAKGLVDWGGAEYDWPYFYVLESDPHCKFSYDLAPYKGD